MTSHAPLNQLLDQLECIEKHGTGWRAKCPSHDGKSVSSLSIASADDGRILIHCFGGCEPLAIVHAVGLELSDLFPKRITNITSRLRRSELRLSATQSQWAAACSMLELEDRVVWIAGKQIHAGASLNAEDAKRLDVALARISDARGVIYGKS